MGVAPTYVVTGAAGFIGRRAVGLLASAGSRVFALDPRGGEWPAGVEGAKTAPRAEGGIVLVHLAWNMERESAKAQAESVECLGEWLARGDVAGIVGMGSAEESGEREGRLSEDAAPGERLSLYGRAKHEACRMLERWAGCGRGRRALWLRPFLVYGPGQAGGMAIPYALRCAKEKKVAELSEGGQLRDFVQVDDVAEGVVLAAQSLASPGPVFAAINLGRGEPVRVRDVLERIGQRMRATELFRFGARSMRPGEPMEQYAEVGRAMAMLGWRAKTPWESGIDAVCGEAVR